MGYTSAPLTMTNWRPLAVLLLVVALPTVIDAQEWGPTTPTPAPRADIDQRATRPQGSLEGLFAINAALLSTAQWAAKSDVARGAVFGSSSLDITVTMRPTDSMRVFLDLEGLAGQGPDQELGTLSRLNKNADDIL